jgi:hypothetical protein
MIEDFRLKIEDLRYAIDLIFKRAERSDFHKYSILILQSSISFQPFAAVDFIKKCFRSGN